MHVITHTLTLSYLSIVLYIEDIIYLILVDFTYSNNVRQFIPSILLRSYIVLLRSYILYGPCSIYLSVVYIPM